MNQITLLFNRLDFSDYDFLLLLYTQIFALQLFVDQSKIDVAKSSIIAMPV